MQCCFFFGDSVFVRRIRQLFQTGPTGRVRARQLPWPYQTPRELAILLARLSRIHTTTRLCRECCLRCLPRLF